MATESTTVRKRPGMGAKSVRDMILSLIAVMLAGAGIYLFIPHSGGNGVHAVTWEDSVPSARRAAPYQLLAPASAPKGWTATSVHYDGEQDHTWTLGFIDDKGQYAAVQQATGAVEDVVKNATVDAAKQPAVTTVDGVAWTHYQGTRYQALVRETPQGTSVVFGTESFARLADFVALLKTG